MTDISKTCYYILNWYIMYLYFFLKKTEVCSPDSWFIFYSEDDLASFYGSFLDLFGDITYP